MLLQITDVAQKSVETVIGDFKEISIALYAFLIVILVLLVVLFFCVRLVFKMYSKEDAREKLTINFAQQLLEVAQEFKNIVNNVNIILEQKTEILSNRWELNLNHSNKQSKSENHDLISSIRKENIENYQKIEKSLNDSNDKFDIIIKELHNISKCMNK